jgi:ATP-dependent DNA helicase RecG
MADTQLTPVQLLATPVQYLKGVGPQRADLLKRLGLNTARDVLFYFPRDYQDFSNQRDVAQLEEGKLQSVRGVIEEVDFRTTASGGSIMGMLVRSPTGYVRGLWFNQPHLRDKYTHGQKVLLAGKPKYEGLVWQMNHPRVETLDAEEEEPKNLILPVYPLTEGLQQWHLRKIVRGVLDEYVGLLDEVFTEEFRREHELLSIKDALLQIHFPPDRESIPRAKRRFVYQELFVLQLALAIKRWQQHDKRKAPALEATAKIDARIQRLFPFELTEGQKKAIAEISADMAGPLPMNRLLQGDVGSGKTLVAVYAMLLAVAHGYQAVLMAPTEVLARQHAQTLEKMLVGSQVRRAQLTGGMNAAQREAILQLAAAGEVDIVVGTQAIIQEDVSFAKLGLVVIDEQHKFGVLQRAVLKLSGLDPHYLVMTATPIPRTVAMTLFGDLDFSTLKDFPPGRQKVHTYLAGDERREKWWDFFRKKLREGRQGYVIAPWVDEGPKRAGASSPPEMLDEKSSPAAASSTSIVTLEQTFESLTNGELADFRLGLIHGRLHPEEKDAIMDDFRRNEIQVLVSTSVVEVGVDVPNATLMTIESGERFGLAQLHQLRGRISRGRFPGFCCVFGNPQTEDSIARLKAFVSSTDGFELAETDFKIRGPGDLFGTKQHGLPPLRIANLLLDGDILAEARRDAQEFVKSDPGLAEEQHALLKRMMMVRYGKALELGDVG